MAVFVDNLRCLLFNDDLRRLFHDHAALFMHRQSCLSEIVRLALVTFIAAINALDSGGAEVLS
jgi:hypothetical protein